MKGEELGGYRLIDELGSGGMATVYRAVAGPAVDCVAEGEQVAVKVLHPHLHAAESILERFLQEAELGKKVIHPNVVRTLDAGAETTGGREHYFLVMEYVEGQTLRALLDDLGCVNERLCRHVGREVASALAEIHRAGIIHRDIKPENVLITRDEAVRVMDLGIAVIRDQMVRLTHTGVFVGSLLYAAPEQLVGGTIDLDVRSDLYALGLLLHELVTGKHPFLASNYAELVRGLPGEDPPRPSIENPQVSPFFEELILRLLSKDIEERFATADEVRNALDRGESGSWWQSVAAASEAGIRPPLRRMRVPRETSLFGRGREVDLLRNLWDRVKGGEGQVLLLEGEAGIGKTRLVDEFAAMLADEGEVFSFIFGEYPPAGGATAARAFSDAYMEYLPGVKLEEKLGDLLGGRPALVSAFAMFLRGEPLPASKGLNRDAILATFANLNRGLARERPTFILIDDLHFAPEEGHGLFATLAHAHALDRILLVATVRPGMPPEFIAGLTRLAHVTHTLLKRLDVAEVGGILEEALGSPTVASDLAPRLAQMSDGVPYFLFEILSSLKQEKLLYPKADGAWTLSVPADRLPLLRSRSVKDLVQARLLPLDETDRELLEASACCGFEFDPVLVADALGMGRIPALKRLGRIERNHRIVRSLGRSFMFDHHQVHETIYEALSLPLREEYHAALGTALERVEEEAGRGPGDVPGETACAIAIHLLKGRQGERARAFLEKGLDHLVSGFSHHRALELADLGLDTPDLLNGAARAHSLLTKAKILRFTGRGQHAEELLREAQPVAAEIKAAALDVEIRRELGRQLWETGRSDEAVEILQAAAELAAREITPAVAGSILGDLGHVHAHNGRYDEAADCYERSLSAARVAKDPYAEANAIGSLGLHAYEIGRLEDARELLAQCLPLFRDLGNLPGEGRTSGNLGLVCIDLGDFEAARTSLERSLDISREIGYRRGEANALGNLGLVHRANGLWELALDNFESDVRIRREMGDPWSEGMALQMFGCLHTSLGALDLARELLDRALELLDEVGYRWGRVTTVQYIGDVLSEQGEAGAAEARWIESKTEAIEIGKASATSEALLALGRARLREGDPSKARETLEKCRELAGEADAANLRLRANAYLCRLGDSSERTRAELAEHSSRLYRTSVMEASFQLWRADGRQEDLDRARDLLEFLTDHAPERYRRSLRENVRLHREILRAAAGAEEA